MSSDLSLPPDDLPAPNLESWPAGKPLVRVHNASFGATEFNPGAGHGRFHPIRDRDGILIPTLYGSDTIDGALSETIFHDVPVQGPAKAVRQSTLKPLLACTLAVKRDLILVQLRQYGLRKLGLERRQLIDTDADQYETTRTWGAVLHDAAPTADGLIWTSRQHDTSAAIVLFGTRVSRSDLEIVEPPRGLYPPSPGWFDVLRAAEAAGITIVVS